MVINKANRIAHEQELVEKWNWITEGIEDYDTKLNTSLVLDSSYDEMVASGQATPDFLEKLDEEVLSEAPTISTDSGSNLIPRVLFPIIRRVYPTLIANKLVSVQPIQARTGVIYYIQYQFTNIKGEITDNGDYKGVTQQVSPAFHNRLRS